MAKITVHDDENPSTAVTVSSHGLDDGRQVVTVEITTGRKTAAPTSPSPFEQLEAVDAEIDARQSAPAN